jgi:hypothetical protein
MKTKTLFIIPLKSAKNSQDWKMVCELLNCTLASIEGQKSKDHHTYIVCTEKPTITANIEKTTIFCTDIRIEGEFTDDKGSLDKQQKVYFGLSKAVDLHPHNVMLVDADDLLRYDLLFYCQSQSNYSGFILNKGYRLFHGHNYLTKLTNFNRVCGTYAIFPYEKEYFVKYPNHTRDFSRYYITSTPHNIFIDRDFRERGIIYKFVPFYGAIYVRNHGDNLRVLPSGPKFFQSIIKKSSAGTFQWTIKKRIPWIIRKIKEKFFRKRKITKRFLSQFNGLEDLLNL